jgi:hypothetical protein
VYQLYLHLTTARPETLRASTRIYCDDSSTRLSKCKCGVRSPTSNFCQCITNDPKMQTPGSHVVTASVARFFDAADAVLGRRSASNARYAFLNGAERL